MLFAVALGLTAAAFVGDDACIQWMRAHQHRSVAAWASKVSRYGDWPALMGSASLALVAAWMRRARVLVHLLLCMMLASTIAGAITDSVRLLTGRTRPGVRDVAPGWYGLWYGNTPLLRNNRFHSFPSGHTASAFAFFGTIGWARRGRAWLFLGFAGIIAWSRLYLDAHHLSDVTVALIIGLFLSYVVWRRAGPPLERWLNVRGSAPGVRRSV